MHVCIIPRARDPEPVSKNCRDRRGPQHAPRSLGHGLRCSFHQQPLHLIATQQHRTHTDPKQTLRPHFVPWSMIVAPWDASSPDALLQVLRGAEAAQRSKWRVCKRFQEKERSWRTVCSTAKKNHAFFCTVWYLQNRVFSERPSQFDNEGSWLLVLWLEESSNWSDRSIPNPLCRLPIRWALPFHVHICSHMFTIQLREVGTFNS